MTPDEAKERTVFSDEDLKLLKKEIQIHKRRIITTNDGIALSGPALLARMEAAERFVAESRCQIGCNCDNECEIHWPLEKAWRKSAGKDAK